MTSAIDRFFRPRADAADADVRAAIEEASRGAAVDADDFARPTTDGLAYLALSRRVVHPRLAPLIAAKAGLSVADVLDLARYHAYVVDGAVVRPDAHEPTDVADAIGMTPAQLAPIAGAHPAIVGGPGDAFPPSEHLDASGSPALAALLGEAAAAALLLELVPVPPASERPLRPVEGGHAMPWHDNVAYAALARASAALTRMLEVSDSPLMHMVTARAVQERFEALCATLADPAGATAWSPRAPAPPTIPPPPAEVELYHAPDPTVPIGAAFAGDDELLIQYPYVLVRMRRDGRVLDRIDAPGQRLVAVSADGGRVVTARDGLHVLDLRTRTWRDAYPDDLPCVHVIDGPALVDPRRGGARALSGLDERAFHAVSPDGRHLWIDDAEANGGVFSADSGLRVLDVAALHLEDRHVRTLRASGELLPAAPDDAADADPDATTAALVLAGGRFRLAAPFADHTLVTDDDRPLLVLEGPPPVVAFSRDGAELLVVRKAHATIVALEDPDTPVTKLSLARAARRAPASRR